MGGHVMTPTLQPMLHGPSPHDEASTTSTPAQHATGVNAQGVNAQGVNAQGVNARGVSLPGGGEMIDYHETGLVPASSQQQAQREDDDDTTGGSDDELVSLIQRTSTQEFHQSRRQLLQMLGTAPTEEDGQKHPALQQDTLECDRFHAQILLACLRGFSICLGYSTYTQCIDAVQSDQIDLTRTSPRLPLLLLPLPRYRRAHGSMSHWGVGREGEFARYTGAAPAQGQLSDGAPGVQAVAAGRSPREMLPGSPERWRRLHSPGIWQEQQQQQQQQQRPGGASLPGLVAVPHTSRNTHTLSRARARALSQLSSARSDAVDIA
jgi:hypothetical protein